VFTLVDPFSRPILEYLFAEDGIGGKEGGEVSERDLWRRFRGLGSDGPILTEGEAGWVEVL